MKTEENEKLEEWLKWRRGYLSLFYGERMRPQRHSGAFHYHKDGSTWGGIHLVECLRNVEEGRPPAEPRDVLGS